MTFAGCPPATKTVSPGEKRSSPSENGVMAIDPSVPHDLRTDAIPTRVGLDGSITLGWRIRWTLGTAGFAGLGRRFSLARRLSLDVRLPEELREPEVLGESRLDLAVDISPNPD
jgi:hypothetical protein